MKISAYQSTDDDVFNKHIFTQEISDEIDDHQIAITVQTTPRIKHILPIAVKINRAKKPIHVCEIASTQKDDFTWWYM